ncbi:MAG: hypothetical protein E7549_06830 [Ruminococcaceae bacterium]|nr:hypothetical protein [Oscillospiraceae bacterium]
MKKNWWRWALVLLWFVVISLFSSQTREESGRLSGGITVWIVEHITPNWKSLEEIVKENLLQTWRFIIRKGAHMAEFAVLGMLLFNAWAGVRRRALSRCALLSMMCSFLGAVLDEAHQAFVPERGPLLSDVFIDFAGAVLGILFVWLVVWIFQKYRKRKETHAFS